MDNSDKYNSDKYNSDKYNFDKYNSDKYNSDKYSSDKYHSDKNMPGKNRSGKNESDKNCSDQNCSGKNCSDKNIPDKDMLKYDYWLCCIQGCTKRVRRTILKECRNAREIYELSRAQLEKISGLMHKDVARIIESKNIWDIDGAWVQMIQSGISFTSISQAEYPRQLRELPDAPYGIFYKGSLPPQEEFRVAIVGARRCSEYGRSMAKELAKELAAHDAAIVSGMAEGIDAAGHRGALNSGGSTYAVFGCGVDVCYPNCNRQLYHEIAGNGGLLSEYPPGTHPLPSYFPQRNRIISILSDVVIVVEAKEKSGSLITADFALEQGRDVYAVPGRITDTLSCGCNKLIAQGAGIILSVEDCILEFSLEAVRKKYTVQKQAAYKNITNLHKFSLEKDESLVYGCFGILPTGLEEILEKTGLDVQTAGKIIAALRQKNLIEEVFKNHYKKITE